MKVERSRSKTPTATGYRKERAFKISSSRVNIDRSTTKVRNETGKKVTKVHNRSYGKTKKS